jgi:hypothetical protein
MFCMIISVNSCYFLKQKQQTDFCNGEVFSLRYGLNSLIFRRASASKVSVDFDKQVNRANSFQNAQMS